MVTKVSEEETQQSFFVRHKKAIIIGAAIVGAVLFCATGGLAVIVGIAAGSFALGSMFTMQPIKNFFSYFWGSAPTIPLSDRTEQVDQDSDEEMPSISSQAVMRRRVGSNSAAQGPSTPSRPNPISMGPPPSPVQPRSSLATRLWCGFFSCFGCCPVEREYRAPTISPSPLKENS